VKDEDDIDDLSEDVDFAVGNTLKWLRSEERKERNKRRAEEQAEEDKKRRATEGYRPAFVSMSMVSLWKWSRLSVGWLRLQLMH
jgi:hypothetical protein